MAETQKKLLEAIINLFRPGTKESELLTTLKKMGADEFPQRPSGKDLLATGTIAERAGLNVSPPKAETGAVSTKPLPQTTTINVRTGEVEGAGPGPDPVTASGSPPKDPLEESVRSVSVIEDVTKPVKNEYGRIVRGEGGEVLRKVTNPGIETRVRALIKDPKIHGQTKKGKPVPVTREADYGKEGTKTLPASPRIEEQALEERAIQAAKNQAEGAPKATKIVEGKKIDQYGDPIKSTGNEPVSTTSPDEIFGEVGVGVPTGELIRGSAEVDQMLDAALKTPKTPPKTKAVGPVTAGMRKPDDIDFEGEAITKEAERVKDLLAQRVNVDVETVAKEFGNRQNANAYIQDVVTRFQNMFNTRNLGAARQQGSAASKLRDEWKELSTLAAAIRNPKTEPKRRIEMMRKVVDIDNRLTDNNRTLEEIAVDYKKGDIATENMPGTSVKQYLDSDDLSTEFDDFIAPSKDLESSAFQRSADELSKQRMIEARQGPTIQRQLEMYPREQLLQAASDRARMNPPGIVERMRPGEPTFEQSLMQTLREIQSMPSPQPNPNLALKPRTPINQELRERYKGRNIDPNNPIVMQLLRRAKRGTR